MNVGIIGSGPVARALGRGFVELRHQVKLGSRSPEKLQSFIEEVGASASSGSCAEAASFGELVVLATSWSGTEQAIGLAEPENLAGKVVIDVTNPLVRSGDGPPALALGHTDSGGEQVQRWLSGAHVVKAFNIVGNAAMFKPDFADGPPTMFVCGDDESARHTVTGICSDFGWPVIDIGGMAGARLLEPLCILWVTYGLKAGSWDHAFKLLTK